MQCCEGMATHLYTAEHTLGGKLDKQIAIDLVCKLKTVETDVIFSNYNVHKFYFSKV